MKEISVIDCPADAINPLKIKTDGKYENLVILTGNHSFDININVEADMITKIVTNRGNFFDGTFNTNFIPNNTERVQKKDDVIRWPSIQIKQKNGIRIEFLDFNMYPSYCYLLYGKDKYNDCYYIKSLYGIYPKFDEAELYTQRLIQAINTFSTKANWRVVRMHNSIFNVEGTPSEQSQFFAARVDSQGNTLLDLMKNAKVNIVLASHNHFAEVSIFPWQQLSALKERYSNNPFFLLGQKAVLNVDGTPCNLIDNVCQNTCYFNDKFLYGWTENYDCSGKNLNIKINPQDPQNLIVFIVGMSGRKIENIQSDQKTAAAVLFDSGIPNKFGGLSLNFYDKYFNGSYFSNGESILDIQSTYVESGKDRYEILNNYVRQKINGEIVNNTKTFNYSFYNTTLSSSSIKYNIFIFIILALILVF
jgi:hypothetical protein